MLVAVGLLGALAPSAGAAAQPKLDKNATLVIANTTLPIPWDPIKQPNPNPTGMYDRMAYDQILQLDQNLQPSAMLATSWKTSQDGLTTTFKLRDDVKFWDGSPLDAAAVKANLDRAKAPPSLLASLLTTMTSVAAPDATTVEVTFSAPNYTFPILLAGDPRTSSIVNPKAFSDPTLPANPQGSGPYKVTTSSPALVSFERVPNHWDKKSGQVAKVDMQPILDATARVNALRSGQVMAIAATVDQVPDLQQFITKGSQFNLNELTNGVSVWAIQLNITKPNISNVLVREAMNLVIDRKALNSVLFNGAGYDSQQLFPKAMLGHVDSLDSAAALKPNVRKAKALMAQAGLSNGFTLTMGTQNLNITQQGIQIIQQQLAQIGITVEPTVTDSATMLTNYTGGKVDSMYFPLASSVDPTQAVAASITAVRGFGNPPYLDQAIKDAAVMPLGPARTKAYENIQKTLVTQPVHVITGQQFQLVPGTKKVVGLDKSVYSRIASIMDTRNLAVTK